MEDEKNKFKRTEKINRSFKSEKKIETDRFNKIDTERLGTEGRMFLSDYKKELNQQYNRMKDEKELKGRSFDEYISNMNYFQNEYIVEGALLTCSKCTKNIKSLRDERNGEVIQSELVQAEERSRIRIIEERTEDISGKIPVTVEDCKGGLTGDIDRNGEVNIVSLGNCDFLEDSDSIQEVIRELKSMQKEDIWSGNIPEADEVIAAMKKGLGTCHCFMVLADKWENMPLEIGDALEGKYNLDSIMPSRGGMCLYDDSYMKFDGKEGINMMSMLFCEFGGGCVMATESGQHRVYEMSLDEALTIMTKYLKNEGISEDEVNEIISWVADNCGLTVNDMVKGDFSKTESVEAHERSQSFDEQIIAWTYYWNVKMENIENEENKFQYTQPIDPNIVKAIIARESSFGLDTNGSARNPSRNVMQSISTGNSIVWEASGINPYWDGMFHAGDKIAYKKLDGTIETDGDLPGGNLLTSLFAADVFQTNRKMHHYEDFDILKNMFTFDENGRYMVVFENVTTNMSIATGIVVLANKIEENENLYDGVNAYNGSNPGYINTINGFLDDMEAETIVR